MSIKRKFCRLHGWAPHVVYKASLEDWLEDNVYCKICCRCHPPAQLSRVQKIKNFLKGFKLPESVSAKQFIGDRFK